MRFTVEGRNKEPFISAKEPFISTKELYLSAALVVF